MSPPIAGGHGKIALRLLGLLAERGDRGRGLIRNPDHAADFEALGATAVGADLENLDPDAIGRAHRRRGRRGVRRRRRAGQRPGPKAHRRLRGRGEADRRVSPGEDLALPDGQRDGRPRPRRPRRADAALLRGKARGRRRLWPPAASTTRSSAPGRLTDDPGTGLVEVASASSAAARSPATTSPRPCSPASTTPARSAPSST